MLKDLCLPTGTVLGFAPTIVQSLWSLSLLIFLAGSATAQCTIVPSGKSPAYCDTRLIEEPEPVAGSSVFTIQPLGGRRPLILIHGISGTSDDVLSNLQAPDNSYFAALIQNFFRSQSFRNQYKIYRFHYPTNRYEVLQIAAALVNRVDDIPLEAPLTIVAHSMGGLLTRAALRLRIKRKTGDWVGARFGDQVEKVITLATPHHGTLAANEIARDCDLGRESALAELGDWKKFGFFKNGVDKPNRSDLVSDDHHGKLSERKETCAEAPNSLLPSLNSPVDERKMVVFYGDLSRIPSSSIVFQLAALYLQAAWDRMAFSDRTIVPFNDGVVPVESGRFDGGYIRERRIRCQGYNHADMQGSGTRKCDSGFTLREAVLRELTSPSGFIGPLISASVPTEISAALGSEVLLQIPIANVGDAPLTITGLILADNTAGDYSLQSTSPVVVPADSRAAVSLSFRPSALGIRSAKLSFISNSVVPLTPPLLIRGTGIESGGSCIPLLSTQLLSFPATAATGNLVVRSSPNCGWSAIASASWVEMLAPLSGTGTATQNLGFAIHANKSSTPRTAVIGVAGGGSSTLLRISQDGAGNSCILTLSPNSKLISAAGAVDAFTVLTGSSCAWSASSSSPWITLPQTSLRTGSQAVSFIVAPNAVNSFRAGSISVQLQSAASPASIFQLQQGAQSSTAGSSCQYAFSSLATDVSSVATTGTVSIQTGAACAWSAYSLEPWLRVTSAASGVGPAVISFAALENVVSDSRRGVISVQGAGEFPAHYVEQAGAARKTPSLVLDANSISFGSALVGRTVLQSLSIRNSGAATLGFGSFRVDPPSAEFTVVNTVASIGPGTRETITVAFSPSGLGTKTATIRVDTSDPLRPSADIPLSGTGVNLSTGGTDFKWVSKSLPPEPRPNTTATTIGANIYFFGGGAVKRNHRYDPTLDLWTNLPDTPIGCSDQSAAAWNGKIYVLGELAPPPRAGQTIVQTFDPTLQTWSDGPYLPVMYPGGVLASANGRLYAFNSGGVFELDSSGSSWTRKGDVRTQRYMPMVAVLNNRVFLLGGGAPSQVPMDLTESYDPVTNSWTIHDPLPEGRKLGTAVGLQSAIYVLGGLRELSPRTVGSVLEFDPSRQRINPFVPTQWQAKVALSAARYGAAAGVVNNKIYVGGGRNVETSAELFSVEEGTLATSPEIAVSSTNAVFPDTTIGTISQFPFTIQNRGSAALSYSFAFAGSTEFSLPFPNGMLQPGETISMTLRLTPTSLGSRSATLSINSDDTRSPRSLITMTGTGLPPPQLGGPAQFAFRETWGALAPGNLRVLQFLSGQIFSSRESPAAVYFQLPQSNAPRNVISLSQYPAGVPEQLSVISGRAFIPLQIPGSSGLLVVADLASRQILQTLPAGLNPRGSAVLDNVLYLTDSTCLSSDTPALLRRYNIQTYATLSPIILDGAAGRPAVDAESSRVFIPVSNCNGRPANLTVIDAVSGAVTATVPMPLGPHSALARDGKVYVTTTLSIEVVDIQTNRIVRSIPLPDRTIAISQSANYLFASGLSGQAVFVISPLTDSVVATLPIAATPFLAADPDTNNFYMESPSLGVLNFGGLYQPDFSISSTPQLVNISPGGTATFEAILRMLDGADRASLTRGCLNVPPGFSCTVTDIPQTTLDRQLSLWRFHVLLNADNVLAGNYSIRFGAFDGQKTRSAAITVAVPSCIVQLSSVVTTFSAGGGSAPVSVAGTVGCAWTASSNAQWLTISGSASGAGMGSVTIVVVANATQNNRSATLSIGNDSITITQVGAAAPPGTFTIPAQKLTLPSTAGEATLLLNSTTTNGAWTASTNAAWLSVTPRSGVGTATLSYSFQANRAVGSRSALITAGGIDVVVMQAGTGLPSVESTGPIAGAGTTKDFVFQFSHPEGFQKLGVLNVLINQALDGGNACYVAYSTPLQILYLVNDSGPASGLSAPMALRTNASVSNSQCVINSQGSSAQGAGSVLTLTLSVTFKPTFAGNKVIYLAARDVDEVNSGWSTVGAHAISPPSAFPRPISLAPDAGTAASGILTLQFEDQSNADNLQTVWALINTAVDARQACYVAYYRPGNLLFLYPDNGDGTQATNIPLTGANVLENSQCRIEAQGSTASKLGPRLTLNLNVRWKPAFFGFKGVWAAAQTLGGMTSSWEVLGAWQVPK